MRTTTASRRDRLGRLILGVLAATELAIGAWAEFAPHAFYRSFPVGGWHWIEALGRYDEHLLRDFGGLSLALAVVTAAAAIQPTRAALVTAVAAWEIYSIPHLIFHALHTESLPSTQNAASLTSLAATVVLPALACVLSWPRTTVTVSAGMSN